MVTPSAENDRYGFLSSDGYPEEGPNPLIKPPPSAENDELALEERWVPVAESGARWKPRTKERALRDMADWPVGVCYLDGEPGDGVAYIEQETRYVTEWRTGTRITPTEVARD